MRQELELHLREEEIEDFMVWAYGDYYAELEGGMDFLKAWNFLHSNLLMLTPSGCIGDDLPRMVAFWEARKE